MVSCASQVKAGGLEGRGAPNFGQHHLKLDLLWLPRQQARQVIHKGGDELGFHEKMVPIVHLLCEWKCNILNLVPTKQWKKKIFYIKSNCHWKSNTLEQENRPQPHWSLSSPSSFTDCLLPWWHWQGDSCPPGAGMSLGWIGSYERQIFSANFQAFPSHARRTWRGGCCGRSGPLGSPCQGTMLKTSGAHCSGLRIGEKSRG